MLRQQAAVCAAQELPQTDAQSTCLPPGGWLQYHCMTADGSNSKFTDVLFNVAGSHLADVCSDVHSLNQALGSAPL